MVITCCFGYRCTNPWCTYNGHATGKYFDRVWEATAPKLAPSLKQLPAKNDEWNTGSYVEVLGNFQALLTANQAKEVSWPSNLCAVMNELRSQVAAASTKGHALRKTEALSPLLGICRKVAEAVCKEIHHEDIGDTNEPLVAIIDKLLLLDFTLLRSNCIYQVALSADLVRAASQSSAVHYSVKQQPDKAMASSGNLLLLAVCSLMHCLNSYAEYLQQYPNGATLAQQQAAQRAVQTGLAELQAACLTAGGGHVKKVRGEWWQQKLSQWLPQMPASSGPSVASSQSVAPRGPSKRSHAPAESSTTAAAAATTGRTLNLEDFAKDLLYRSNLHRVH